MNLKLAISCAGFVATAGAAVTRANHRTAIAVDANGGTSLVDEGVPHADVLLQSLRGGISKKENAAKMVSVVEDLAKHAARVGTGPDMDLVNNIKDFAQGILDHTTANHDGDNELLQAKLAAIQGCPALHSGLLDEAGDLKGQMESHRGAHESCRGEEVELDIERESRCQEYDNKRSEANPDMNGCTKEWFLEDNVAMDENVDNATVVKMEHCLVLYTPWIKDLHTLYLACHAAEGAHGEKTGDCNQEQVEFEHGFCDYSNKLGDHCEQVGNCYDTAVADQAATRTHVEAREGARKADWTAGSRIACYAKVFEAVDQGEKESVLSGCQAEVINTDHLTLTYPDVPARQECTLTESKPCDATWQSGEYSSKDWHVRAKAADCRPCS